jgi:hypothetical protein
MLYEKITAFVLCIINVLLGGNEAEFSLKASGTHTHNEIVLTRTVVGSHIMPTYCLGVTSTYGFGENKKVGRERS